MTEFGDVNLLLKLRNDKKNRMKKNVGNIDKMIRVVIAIIAGTLYFTGTVTGVLGYVALGVGAIMLLTAVMSRCPLFSIFGFSSCPFEVKKD